MVCVFTTHINDVKWKLLGKGVKRGTVKTFV